MRITKPAIAAFNKNVVVTFNDSYNALAKIGTKAENDVLHRIAAELWGICRDGQKIKPADILRAGHSV